MYVLLVVFSYLLVYYLGWMGWDTYLQFGTGNWWAGTRTYSLGQVTHFPFDAPGTKQTVHRHSCRGMRRIAKWPWAFAAGCCLIKIGTA